jgi:ribosomal protein S17E
MAWIGDYWSDKKTTKIVDLLHKYQDVFSRDYKDLKGLVQEMGEMKIDLIPGSKPIKK